MSNRIGNNLVHFAANQELVHGFFQNGVRFVVVGGLAIAWHRQERTADDMDLLVEPTPENSAKVAAALKNLKLLGFTQESFTKPGLQFRLKAHYYAELLTPKQDGLSFLEVEANAVDANLFNIPVRLASVSTLVEMKKDAVRSAGEQQAKHLKDIELLEKEKQGD